MEKRGLLSLATPTAIQKAKQQEPGLFQPANYDKKAGVLMNYLPGAAGLATINDHVRHGCLI